MGELPPPAWWPHRERSQCIDDGGFNWHVQRWPKPGCPLVLLLHGTGSATHSWRHLAPLLARHFDVLALDLPGHAFTATAAEQSLSLPAVADAVAGLLKRMGLAPVLLCGHSAGAAVALQLVMAGHVSPHSVVAINGALLPLQGPLGRWFLPLARLLAMQPWVPAGFARWATLPGVARSLLAGTGSRIDALGERCYAHLVASPAHAAGALRLMASWDLAPLASTLPSLDVPTWLLAGTADRTLPPEHARQVQQRLPRARCVMLPGLGHLAHEEDAQAVMGAAWPACSAALTGTLEPATEAAADAGSPAGACNVAMAHDQWVVATSGSQPSPP